MFEGRLPARLQADAPQVVETDEGHEVWEFDGQIFFQVGLNAVVGRDPRGLAGRADPLRRDAARAAYDIDAAGPRHGHQRRVGVGELPAARSPGFCGSVFSRCSDPELGLAVTRAWNDWFFDEWYSRAPRPHRPDGHHVPRRPRAGRRGDPPQRRTRVHRGDAARAAAPHRHAVDLLAAGGIRSSRRARRPTP